MVVVVVLEELRDVMRTLNSDRLYLIGRVIKITNHVPKIHKLVGVINAGAIKGIRAKYTMLMKRHYSDEDFYRRKFDLLEDQIMVWTEEFHVAKFEVWLNNSNGSQGNTKTVVDPMKARLYVLRWREEWECTGRTPNIKIRPV